MKKLRRSAALSLCGLLACFVPPDAEDESSDTGATSGSATMSTTAGASSSGTPATTGTSSTPTTATSETPTSESGASDSSSTGNRPPNDGEMVRIEGAIFMMGCDSVNDATCVPDPVHPHITSEMPRHEVSLSSYLIDIHEVTLEAFLACVDAGACDPPGENWEECNVLTAGHDDHPVDCVTWDQGNDYCSWAGKRLPTEAEWEYAARGADERIYPWGNQPPDCSLANLHFNEVAGCGTVDTYAVGSLPAGQSPFGVMDMCGNVAEFVADYFSTTYYAESPDSNPTGPRSGDTRVLRGGGYNFPLDGWIMRASSRTSFDSVTPSPQIGFRCARNAEN